MYDIVRNLFIMMKSSLLSLLGTRFQMLKKIKYLNWVHSVIVTKIK